MSAAPDYRAALRHFITGYQGEREQAIERAGDVFEFYTRLYADRELIGDARRLAAAVLAYFVVPEDVLPEELLGPWGMVDDLYLAAHVFRLLRKDVDGALLARAWHGEGNVEDVMKMVYAETKCALGKQRKDVLRMAGL